MRATPTGGAGLHDLVAGGKGKKNAQVLKSRVFLVALPTMSFYFQCNSTDLGLSSVF